jgi:hypothetical protein
MSANALTPDCLTLGEHGAEFVSGGLDLSDVMTILSALADHPSDQAGVRLYGIVGLHLWLAADGVIGRLAASRLMGNVRPVRAILFDKTPKTTWALGWHQDRVVAVKKRMEAPGFGPWTRKHGALHVAPPAEVLSRMLTVRVHLDDVPIENAPLQIAPGSHRLGRIFEADVPKVVAMCGVIECQAARGDIWIYSTPVLHASGAARSPLRRRVLQVDYAAEDLPHGLEWLGI